MFRQYARPCTPEAPLTAVDIAQASLPANVSAAFANKLLTEDFLLPMNSVSSTCNEYLPNGPTALPGFLWVVEYLVASGLYVLVSKALRSQWCHAGTRLHMLYSFLWYAACVMYRLLVVYTPAFSLRDEAVTAHCQQTLRHTPPNAVCTPALAL